MPWLATLSSFHALVCLDAAGMQAAGSTTAVQAGVAAGVAAPLAPLGSASLTIALMAVEALEVLIRHRVGLPPSDQQSGQGASGSRNHLGSKGAAYAQAVSQLAVTVTGALGVHAQAPASLHGLGQAQGALTGLLSTVSISPAAAALATALLRLLASWQAVLA